MEKTIYDNLYEVHIIAGKSDGSAIHDYELWSACANALNPLVDLCTQPVDVQTVQWDPSNFDELPFESLDWNDASHKTWTTKHKKGGKKIMFMRTNYSFPSISKGLEQGITPELVIMVEPGDRQRHDHAMLVAVREDVKAASPEILSHAIDQLKEVLHVHFHLKKQRPWGYRIDEMSYHRLLSDLGANALLEPGDVLAPTIEEPDWEQL